MGAGYVAIQSSYIAAESVEVLKMDGYNGILVIFSCLRSGLVVVMILKT